MQSEVLLLFSPARERGRERRVWFFASRRSLCSTKGARSFFFFFCQRKREDTEEKKKSKNVRIVPLIIWHPKQLRLVQAPLSLNSPSLFWTVQQYLNFLLSSPTVLGAILTPTVNLNYQQYLAAAVIILAILAPCKTRLVFKLQAFSSISVFETLNQVS